MMTSPTQPTVQTPTTRAVSSAQATRSKIKSASYLALGASAFLAFFIKDPLWSAIRIGSAPLWLGLLPAISFSIFLLLYAASRWQDSLSGRSSLISALPRVILLIVFSAMLWRNQANELTTARELRDQGVLQKLFTHPNADFRSLACEVVALRIDLTKRTEVEALSKNDADISVRKNCQKQLMQLTKPLVLPENR